MSSVRLVRRLRVAVAVAALVAVPAADARAGWSTTVNGVGFGSVQVDVWCFPNAPPGAPNHTAGAVGFGVGAALGPGLAGCNPATNVSASIGALWSSNHAGAAVGGDTISDVDLYPLVTPTSYIATITLAVSASITAPDTALFTVSWTGSDPGTAQRLRWYSDDSLTVLLAEELRVGPFGETFDKSVTNTGGLAGDIVMVADGIATSTVPEPSALALAAVGAAGVGWARRRRAAVV